MLCNVLTSSCDNPCTCVRERLDLTKQVDVAATCIPDVLFEFRPEYPLSDKNFGGFLSPQAQEVT